MNLTESYKSNSNVDEAIEFIRDNCKKYVLGDKHIYRGMSKSNDVIKFDTNKTVRASANTSNAYTLFLDLQLKKRKFPLRSKSIICTFDKKYADHYSHNKKDGYVVLPSKDMRIAYLPTNDIWSMHLTDKLDFRSFAFEFDDVTSDTLKDDLIDVLHFNSDSSKWLDIYDKTKSMNNDEKYDFVLSLFDLNKLNIKSFKIEDDLPDCLNECWMSGNGMMVSAEVFDEIKNKLKNE